MSWPTIPERVVRHAGVFSLAAVLIAGTLNSLGLLALLPYGHPQPSPEAVAIRFAILHLLGPMFIAGLIVRASRTLWHTGHPPAALTLSLLPTLASPVLFAWGMR